MLASCASLFQANWKAMQGVDGVVFQPKLGITKYGSLGVGLAYQEVLVYISIYRGKMHVQHFLIMKLDI